MELSPEQRATLLSLAQSARAQLETELELGLNGLSAPPTPPRPTATPTRSPPQRAESTTRVESLPPPPPAAIASLPQPDLGRVPAHERLQVLRDLQAEAAQCTGCVLHEKRTKSVFARGSADAELVFVGEGPGRDEDQQGLPFVGAAGLLLDKMIAAMGYGRDEVYICNVVKCRPPDNRTPRPEEMLACSRFLVPQLQAVRPKLIVALGRCAAQALGVAEAMGAWRGRWGSFQGVEVMPTYHPAYLLRSPEQKRTVWADLQLVMARLGKSPPARRS
ncbi:MAG TPA: uracil-DNA glycosylase [Polyangiales bacterium]|nr:uracil-DNA glycosylase [Polyangiales bacterium]